VIRSAPLQKPSRRRRGVPAADAANAPPSAPIVDALRAWRLEEARQRAIAPFVIMHDRTLLAIASSLPRSVDELSLLPGIGPAKLASYGEAILKIVESAKCEV